MVTPNFAPGFAAKVTLLTFSSSATGCRSADVTQDDDGVAYRAVTTSNDVLHQTIVYAQSELLTLTEEPLDTDLKRAG